MCIVRYVISDLFIDTVLLLVRVSYRCGMDLAMSCHAHLSYVGKLDIILKNVLRNYEVCKL